MGGCGALLGVSTPRAAKRPVLPAAVLTRLQPETANDPQIGSPKCERAGALTGGRADGRAGLTSVCSRPDGRAGRPLGEQLSFSFSLSLSFSFSFSFAFSSAFSFSGRAAGRTGGRAGCWASSCPGGRAGALLGEQLAAFYHFFTQNRCVLKDFG